MAKVSIEILSVKIHNAINIDRKGLYEATRGNWYAAKDKANAGTVDYVVGFYEGKVISAYKPIKWFTVIEDGSNQERRRFDGVPVNKDLFEVLTNKQNEVLIKNSYNSGANAISYITLEVDEKLLDR